MSETSRRVTKVTYQFMRAKIVCQIPLLDAPRLVTRDEFALIRMDYNIIDCRDSVFG